MNKPQWSAIELGNYGDKVRTQAMRAGVRALGGKVLACPHSDAETLTQHLQTYDVRFAFTSGNHWQEREARKILDAAGVPVVILDLGYFKRATGAKDREGYNQVGIGRIGWVPSHAVDSSRWDALGLPDALPPVTGRPKSVLILGQVPGDTQHGLNERELNAWYDAQSDIYAQDGYEVVFRPHPKALRATPPKSDRVSKPNSCTLENAIAGAAHVITYNSTAGLDAILAGVSVICDPCAHYFDIARYGLFGTPQYHENVMQHMHRLAWSQWTCAEIERGLPIQFLFPDLAPKWTDEIICETQYLPTEHYICDKKPMKYLVAIPYFGTNPKYLEMLDDWVRNFRERFPVSRFVVFTHDAQEQLTQRGYPFVSLDISGYASVIREGQPFDIKGALMCEAAEAIDEPFLMLDSDALLMRDPSGLLTEFAGRTCAMPIDSGAILSGHKARMDEPFGHVRKMCAGVFWFGDTGMREVLGDEYRNAWRDLHVADCPWTPRLPHLLEQYAWSLAHHRLNGATMPGMMNWAPHITGDSDMAIVNHYFGHKKWNGKAPANT